MEKKKNQPVSRRTFIFDGAKTLFYSSLVSSAIPVFLSGCSKDSCNRLKENSQGGHYCDNYYVCADPRGFSCPATGEFQCGPDLFSCTVEFGCDASANFTCQPSSSFTNPKGGAGS